MFRTLIETYSPFGFNATILILGVGLLVVASNGPALATKMRELFANGKTWLNSKDLTKLGVPRLNTTIKDRLDELAQQMVLKRNDKFGEALAALDTLYKIYGES